MKISVLDLAPVLSGETARQSFKHSLNLARYAEELGFSRYWFAEHHNMAGIASSSPEVLIAHTAAHTNSIRVGSGGIMLPNHPTLHVAEVFKTLEALYPGRIDLGLGRAPGSGQRATRALRGEHHSQGQDFPQQFEDLVSWLKNDSPDSHPKVEAVPSTLHLPEIWILGSSDFGAQMAGHHGLPYAFAQHFSHIPAQKIFELYRESFRPSEFLQAPRAMMATHIICADTDEEAQELALSSDLSFSVFVQTGRSMPLPTVAEAKATNYTAEDWQQIRAGGMPKFVGSPETLKIKLRPYLESGLIDELMVLCMIHDQKARQKSYALTHDLIKSIQ